MLPLRSASLYPGSQPAPTTCLPPSSPRPRVGIDPNGCTRSRDLCSGDSAPVHLAPPVSEPCSGCSLCPSCSSQPLLAPHHSGMGDEKSPDREAFPGWPELAWPPSLQDTCPLRPLPTSGKGLCPGSSGTNGSGQSPRQRGPGSGPAPCGLHCPFLLCQAWCVTDLRGTGDSAAT